MIAPPTMNAGAVAHAPRRLNGGRVAVLLTVIVLIASWTYLRRQLPTQSKV